MAEFKLDRFKFNWRGDWSTATEYKRDDVVRVNGKSYVCIVGHTASPQFTTDLDYILPGSTPPLPQPKWSVMTSGKSFLGNWATATDYNIDDIVLFQGSLWKVNTAHTSNSFDTDYANWDIFAIGKGYLGDWTSGTVYAVNSLVRYGGKIYRCTTAHTSTGTFIDLIQWDEYYNGIDYKGVWQTSTDYKRNDIVKYGGSLFRVTNDHTSGTEGIDDNNIVIESPGSEFDNEWSGAVYYNEGDIVRYGGYLYLANTNNTNLQPDNNPNDWFVLSKSYNFRGVWQVTNQYKPGDVVLRGGRLYVAQIEIAPGEYDGSTLDYEEVGVWLLINPGQTFANNWNLGNHYAVGDVVYHLGSAYIANFEHTATNENFPGDNGNAYEYWDLLIQAGEPGGLHDKGDLLTFGLTRESVGDGSTLGNVRIPIGTSGDVLSVSDEYEAFWRDFGSKADIIFVSKEGNDLNGKGTSNSPFKTVRQAAEYVQDTFDPLHPVTIQVRTGSYDEVGPISIQAGCSVVGDELRSVSIVASGPKTEYANLYPYTKEYTERLKIIIGDLVNNIVFTPSQGNTVTRDFSLESASTVEGNDLVTNLNTWLDYTEFYINDGLVLPTMSGSSTITTNPLRTNAAAIILANNDFILEECYRYVIENNPGVTFDEYTIKVDVQNLLRALRYDLRYEGNYQTLKSAQRYVNSTNGSTAADLFYVRDTTGVRNLTVKGLTGTLNPPGVFELYQRPTGGACISLDPGYGPDDESCWIIRRSPFIQSVTNIGDNCVGQKVDGNLHNGGNRSIVSNDFTQVLSDGIGVWVTNNARVELVSIFTYYCQVGYFAENGGVIRSANGNNSYGRFGTIAEGNDPSEVPQDVTIWNYDNEAVVGDIRVGGALDSIYAIEYQNSGVHYTQASGVITGAGDDAVIEYAENDFRDGAIFEGRLINTTGSGTEGGADYTIRQGYAQITPDATNTIKLSATEVTQFESEIIGMRLVIIEGDGAGQYGYINSYDQATRDVTVRRESDGELGWDHIIPGTPLKADFDATARYRIEPRLTFTAPGYSATASSLVNGREFVDADYGYTSGEYVGLQLNTGTGQTFDFSPINAEVTVTRKGRDYFVTVTNDGGGYAVGDSTIIQGTDLGGTTPDNDLTITVTGVTDDSTTSITSVSTSGTPRGKRMVAIANPNFVVYTDDNNNLVEANNSFVGPFTKIIAGDNKFVAVGPNLDKVDVSDDGSVWTDASLPIEENWTDIAYGGGKFVMVADNTHNVVWSSNGTDWNVANIPDDTENDSAGDSTVSQFLVVAHGRGKFVALSQNDLVSATSEDGINWTRHEDAVLDDGGPTTRDWVSLVYGAGRFVGLTVEGRTYYSFDGITWYRGGDLPAAVSLWREMKYSNGNFFAIPSGNEDTIAYSEYGLSWTEEGLTTVRDYGALTFTNFNNIPNWIVLGKTVTVDSYQKVRVGCIPKARVTVEQGKVQSVLFLDPGSGYDLTDTSGITLTVTDNAAVTSEVEVDLRFGNGCLPQPTFITRGRGYRSSSTVVTITGDGYADIIPEDTIIKVAGVTTVPGPGAQVYIDGILDETTQDNLTDLKLFNAVQITDLGEDSSGNGTRLVQFTLSPALRNEYNLAHATQAQIKTRYSQARITGHDFLDIGTGNFEQTNYPTIYASGAFFEGSPENEVLESNGGRVFYVSTDQNGNFRTGELFAVDQATGVVTISAEFFELDGLSELSLGGVRLGGTGAVVREFSTDPTFAEDSNNVIPTQRAIATFLADRLSVGGENLETNLITAGQVRIGTLDNTIETTTGNYLYINADTVFDGQHANGYNPMPGGTFLGTLFLMRGADDTVQ
jgi:hypothetical protein